MSAHDDSPRDDSPRDAPSPMRARSCTGRPPCLPIDLGNAAPPPQAPQASPGVPHGGAPHGSPGGPTIPRRDALKLLALAPLTGALHFTPAELERASRAMRRDDAQPAPEPKRKFFTPHELATARILADIIIPRDERSGSATDARVPEFMDYMLAEASERTRVEMRGGLAWLDSESFKRFGANFVSITPAQRTAIIEDIAWPARARPELSHGVTFFNGFRDYTASGFYSSEMGYMDVRYVGEVFNPNWNGCPPAALNQLGVSYHDHRNSTTE